MPERESSSRLPAFLRSSNLTMGKGPVFMLIAGVVVGMLITGLAIPYIFGEPLQQEEDTLTSEAFGPGATSGPGAAPGEEDPGDTGSGGGAGGSTPAPGSPGAFTDPSGRVTSPGGSVGSSEVGVTDKEIKIGFLILDVGSLSRVGIGVPGVDPEVQRQGFQAMLDDINKKGGVHGRKLVGVYQNFDVLSQDAMREACLALRDQKVFGIIASGGFFGPAVLCVTQEGGTPLVTFGGDGTSTEYVRKSKGLLFSMFQTSNRQMANWAAELNQLGLLKGKRIGVLTQGHMNPGNTVVGGELAPALKRYGQSIVHVTTLSDDLNTAASQIPVEVQRMQTNRVNLVMIMARSTNSSGFVQAADNQGYRPAYTLSDWASMNSDASNQNMPASYNGTTLITTYKTGEAKAGYKESPPEKDCREIFERGSGRTLDAKDSNQAALITANCTSTKSFFLGLEKAGTNLTRASFSAGMQKIGTFPMSMWGGGSFGPGKFGAADLIRTSKWFGDCRCIKPVSGFRQPKF